MVHFKLYSLSRYGLHTRSLLAERRVTRDANRPIRLTHAPCERKNLKSALVKREKPSLGFPVTQLQPGAGNVRRSTRTLLTSYRVCAFAGCLGHHWECLVRNEQSGARNVPRSIKTQSTWSREDVYVENRRTQCTRFPKARKHYGAAFAPINQRMLRTSKLRNASVEKASRISDYQETSGPHGALFVPSEIESVCVEKVYHRSV